MVPIGGIINWSGAVVDIPDNWQLCDGTNGTPDLRERFVIGAGGSIAVDATGGATTHQHVAGSAVIAPSAAGNSVWENTASGVSSNLPPYYALAYIQRMT